jgi:hypothetical protein
VCERKSLSAILAVVARLELHAKALGQCARIVLVGSGLRTTAGVFYRLLKALTDEQIDVLHFADSNVTISVVVAQRDAAAAERIAHDEIVLGGDGGAAELALRFEAATGRVDVRGRASQLGERQAALLAYFLENGGRVIEIDQLAQAVFGSRSPSTIAALRVHIHNLRKKIEEDPDAPRHVITVPNRGYMFVR